MSLLHESDTDSSSLYFLQKYAVPDKNLLQVFTGNAHPELAERICDYIGIPLGSAKVARFPDGEVEVKIKDDVRGTDVFLVQPTAPPVNENLMELLIMIDSFLRASASRITTVIPYFGYARQDRKTEGRTPISAKLVANLLTTAGADRILTVDLHSGQIQGFFDIPLDHLYAAPVLRDYLLQKNLDNLCVVSPDVGNAGMARGYAKRLDADLAIIDKRRTDSSKTEALHVIGDVDGKYCLLLDDMIATGGTMMEASKVIREQGGKGVLFAATHGLFLGDSLERFSELDCKEVIVTDTIAPKPSYPDVINVLSISELLGEAIVRIHDDRSVSALFI